MGDPVAARAPAVAEAVRAEGLLPLTHADDALQQRPVTENEDDLSVGTRHLTSTNRRVAAAVKKEVLRRISGHTTPPRPGAVGVCDRCGRSVLPGFVQGRRHQATLVYAGRREICLGEVRPLWQGSLDAPVERPRHKPGPPSPPPT